MCVPLISSRLSPALSALPSLYFWAFRPGERATKTTVNLAHGRAGRASVATTATTRASFVFARAALLAVRSHCRCGNSQLANKISPPAKPPPVLSHLSLVATAVEVLVASVSQRHNLLLCYNSNIHPEADKGEIKLQLPNHDTNRVAPSLSRRRWLPCPSGVAPLHRLCWSIS